MEFAEPDIADLAFADHVSGEKINDEKINDMESDVSSIDIYNVPHVHNPQQDVLKFLEDEISSSSEDQIMEINDDTKYDTDQFCIDQTQKFICSKFTRTDAHTKAVLGAKKKIRITTNKAHNSCKSTHRTPITFSTKAVFCSKVEAGMSRLAAWKKMKQQGYEVGRSSGGCHRWAAKGSNYWMHLIAKKGDLNKFSYCIYFFITFVF